MYSTNSVSAHVSDRHVCPLGKRGLFSHFCFPSASKRRLSPLDSPDLASSDEDVQAASSSTLTGLGDTSRRPHEGRKGWRKGKTGSRFPSQNPIRNPGERKLRSCRLPQSVTVISSRFRHQIGVAVQVTLRKWVVIIDCAAILPIGYNVSTGGHRQVAVFRAVEFRNTPVQESVTGATSFLALLQLDGLKVTFFLSAAFVHLQVRLCDSFLQVLVDCLVTCVSAMITYLMNLAFVRQKLLTVIVVRTERNEETTKPRYRR